MKFEFENKLIINLSQVNPTISEVSALLKNKIDWEYVLQTADEHRIVPLIFTQLKLHLSEKPPKAIYAKFQNRFHEISKHNFARSAQLLKLSQLLKNQNFDVLSYKGMTLAELAYKDITLRQFTDIDLLVRKSDFPQIKDLLISNGCRPVWNLTAKQEKATLKYDYEFPFYYGKSDTLLEVHWEFVESFFAFDHDTEKLWERTQNVELYGKQIKTLSNSDYLVVLCSHGSKHFWKRLSWICDVDRLVRNTTIDWDLVIKLANETGSLRMVLLGLYLSKETLKTELPNKINEYISADKTAQSLGKMFSASIFNENKEPDDWKEMAKIHLLMRENIRTKIKYSKRLFTTKLIDKLFLPMGRPQ